MLELTGETYGRLTVLGEAPRRGAKGRVRFWRWATDSQQALNSRKQKNNTTGLVGISRRANGRWQAKAQRGGRMLIQTDFKTRGQAVAARRAALETYHASAKHR